MALDPEGQQELLDKIMAIFTNEAEAASFGEDPSTYIDENLPEGTEPGDIASCMPQVGESLGGSYQANLAGYNSAAAASTQSVAAEIAYTYNTTYQQNTFIYAEEGSQVVNIQGDGNAVSQQQIDAEFNIGDEYGEGEAPAEYEAPVEGEYKAEDAEDAAYPEGEEAEYKGEEAEDAYKPDDQPDYEPDPVMQDDAPAETPMETAPADDGGGMDDMPDM